MSTYSLAVTGQRADSPSGVAVLTLPDAEGGRLGSQQNSMQLNTPLFCKGRDGSFAWYTIDAERSTPSAVILKAV